MNRDINKLQTRDFISVGIFSLIYAAVAFIIGGVAQMTPLTFPFMPMVVALFTGTVFMLYAAKIPKRGAITILGVIAGILLFITGMFWMMSAFFVAFGIISLVSLHKKEVALISHSCRWLYGCVKRFIVRRLFSVVQQNGLSYKICSCSWAAASFSRKKLSVLITCSIRQASASAVLGATPAAISRSVKKQ